MRSSYPSDLNDAEWSVLEEYIPAVKTGGRPATHSRREIGLCRKKRNGWIESAARRKNSQDEYDNSAADPLQMATFPG